MGYVRFRFGERFIDFLFFGIEVFFVFFMDFCIEVEVVHAVFYQVAFLDIGGDGMSQNTAVATALSPAPILSARGFDTDAVYVRYVAV